jgi:hypothetical protein
MTKRQKIIDRLARKLVDRQTLNSREEVDEGIDEIAFADNGVELYLRQITDHSRKMLVTKVYEKAQRLNRHREKGSPAERALQKF